MTGKDECMPGGGGRHVVRPGIVAVVALTTAAFILPPDRSRTDDPARPALYSGTIETVDPIIPVSDATASAAEPGAPDGDAEPLDTAGYLDTDVLGAAVGVAPPFDKESGQILQVGSAADLAAKFAALDYTFDAVRDTNALVPRVFLTSFPEDMETLPTVEERKRVFLKTMLPLVLRVNEAVLHERSKLLGLRDRLRMGETLGRAELRWLSVLARDYGLKRVDLDELVLRVDAVPPSMALAQAAVESGWGTSRYAVQGNAVFGQITFAETGIVPENRKPGETHLFAAFDRLLDGTRSYVRNLNTHRAYAKFRRLRAEQRAEGRHLDGEMLLGGLLSYSELGQDYIDYVRGVIRTNGLEQVDRARLSLPDSMVLEASAI